MKFEKELNDSVTPEWRPKYVDYSTGKGYIQSITNASKNHSTSPSSRRVSSVSTLVGSEKELPIKEADNVWDRQSAFINWINGEVDKVDSFYTLKKAQAGQQLDMLRHQLHEMRSQRAKEIFHAHKDKIPDGESFPRPNISEKMSKSPWRKAVSVVIRPPPPQPPSSHTWENMLPSPTEISIRNSGRKEYIRKDNHSLPYGVVKQQLGAALREHYRSVKVLKSYATLNQKALEKIIKKYDKAVRSTNPQEIMYQKVHKASFARPDALNLYLVTVEDLFTRYIVDGDRKAATRKLKAGSHGLDVDSTSAYRNGLLVGSALIFLLQAVIHAHELLHGPDPVKRSKTGLLLQIYGGYLVILYMFQLFCVNCALWTRAKINYRFIFEYDPGSQLQLAHLTEFASFFTLLLGIISWLNFFEVGGDVIFIYWPIILISFTVLVIVFPFPTLAHKSRGWFLISQGRLFLGGLCPVEFRDLFFGDLYTSLTYSLAAEEIFFCIYPKQFINTLQCDNRHSIVLGFLTALPAILRLLQCLRRYIDTYDAFPHLANAMKYATLVLFQVLLSRYRIQTDTIDLVLLITVGCVNTTFSAIWDLLIDFSLLAPDSSILSPSLRPVRAFKSNWVYIVLPVLNVLLRCTWVLLILFIGDDQKPGLVTFLVALGEVTRRGIWSALRVENEHCANVGKLKAWRDINVPYQLFGLEELERELEGANSKKIEPDSEPYTGQQNRNRRWTSRLADAPRRDFERKRNNSVDTMNGIPEHGDESLEI